MAIGKGETRCKCDGLLVTLLADLMLGERDPNELQRGEPHFRAAQIDAHLIHQLRAFLRITQLLRAKLAVIMTVPKLAFEIARLLVEPTIFCQPDDLFTALPPRAQQFIGREDPHRRKRLHHSNDRPWRIILRHLLQDLLFKAVQQIIDMAKLARLHHEKRVLGKTGQQLQRLEQIAPPDVGHAMIAWFFIPRFEHLRHVVRRAHKAGLSPPGVGDPPDPRTGWLPGYSVQGPLAGCAHGRLPRAFRGGDHDSR